MPKEITVTNTYSPDTPIMDNGDEVPEKKKENINKTIDAFINYCNNKQYQYAFDMITKDCKEYIYSNKLEEFITYVDTVFNTKKIYNVQNYSNVDDVYIYDVNILDDILATGTTGGYQTHKEKFTLIEEDGILKISNQGYIGKKTFSNITSEDNYTKVKVLYKNMSYDREEYAVEVTNKTDGYIVLANGIAENEITLNLGDQSRTALDVINNPIIIPPGKTYSYFLLFDKFYDDGKNPKELNFNLIRVYGDDLETAQGGLTASSEVAYSMNVTLNRD